ncbi:MAG: hypothetical protein K2G87_07070 [Oscillospiraceae bacterium]|nr:hypothetical protein [Oscillospiraceae bacterium]
MNVKKVFACLFAAVMAATLFGCGKVGETVPEETTAPEAAAATLSEEELDELSTNMPEIVFVLSHHYHDTNILGFYITNTGEMKMYDFRNIAPDEIYDIPDVYDRLEEATCSEIYFDAWSIPNVITNDDLPKISREELVVLYQKLLMTNENAESTNVMSLDLGLGDRIIYGVKRTQGNGEEFVVIGGDGEDYVLNSSDPIASELLKKAYDLFPDIPDYNNFNKETAVSTAAEETLTDEELNTLAENMPEIVFVMSHNYDDSNILGCYITNTGEMKMYDFRNIAPDEIYEISDVYDRLEEAVCSEIDFKLYGKYGHLIAEKDLLTVPKNKLAEYYNLLLQINGTAVERRSGISRDDPQYGHYRYYGIKYDDRQSTVYPFIRQRRRL